MKKIKSPIKLTPQQEIMSLLWGVRNNTHQPEKILPEIIKLSKEIGME